LAHSAEISAESTVSVGFERFKDIMYPIDKTSDSAIRNLDIAMDYAVEILKTRPSSIEAYHVIKTNYNIESNEVAFNKYLKLRSKFYGDLDNPNTDTAEKLFFLILARRHDCECTEHKLAKDNTEKYNMGIIKIRKECKDIRYRALAAILPVRDLREYAYFIENFPNHNAIPFMNIYQFNNLIMYGKHDEAIKELLKASKKYPKLKDINGKDYWITCYELLARSYCRIKDYDNANKYLMLIKKNAPEYYEKNFEGTLHLIPKQKPAIKK
jgi:tetratricopeptide (TPR) repeat protein